MTAPKRLDSHLMAAQSHLQAAHKAGETGLCAYLIALAAYQRGLDVSFETFLGDDREYLGSHPDYNGNYLRISDGKSVHVFDKSRGDLSKRVHTSAADSKTLSKKLFEHGNIKTPRGASFKPGNEAGVSRFLASSSADRFVVKPEQGSLGRGVHVGLTAEDTRSVSTRQKAAFVIEEHISGSEYRVFVVGDRCVAAYERPALQVRGDGISSIEALIDARNRQRALNPRTRSSLIDKLEVAATLSRTGRSLDDIPHAFEPVTLSFVRNISAGGDNRDVTDTLPGLVGKAAVMACNATGLPNCGVDIIHDEAADVAYVLEVNSRPHLGAHSFPSLGAGAGNAVADAILDHYFPRSARNERFPELVIDIAAVKSALASGQFRSLACKRIEKGWIHRRIPLDASESEVDGLLRQLRLVCIHVEKFSYSESRHVINAFFLPRGFAGLVKTAKQNKMPVISREVDAILFGRTKR
ncbi:hypothetical protein [Sinisalibacter lacisalsi]|uniref:ATP-grasp domain-containing protein n=1 Tax=Sinisalibacter lacisalsi TaxID=1526570 RepID=A0ABQ1QLD3_9RHOB|nr:hypothetical protein [Sinisalibacter lacisalsi]GGD29900.1 hypothetical protein GCM10011358_12410 [Sinisalibacter lacisalsi]